MADGSEPHPDRSAPARPVRVVRFDDLGAAEASRASSGSEKTVVGFEAFGAEGERPIRVATFGDVDEQASPPSPVASLDLAPRPARTPARRPPEGDRPPEGGTAPENSRAPERPGRRKSRTAGADRAGRAADADPARSTGLAARTTADEDGAENGPADGVPPDGPLPRGRRRGARVGRLGPDAPDPATPAPDADPVAVAREICLRLLTDRARTRQELAQALARKGVPAEATATVLDRFDEVGLIDDAAFAEQWVRSRHAHRGLGRRAIAVELRRKGVADDVAGEALAGVDAESEARRARELVDRKLRSLTVDSAEQRTVAARRLVGMLARKGYGAGVAYGVVREALAEHGADVDELDVDAPD